MRDTLSIVHGSLIVDIRWMHIGLNDCKRIDASLKALAFLVSLNDFFNEILIFFSVNKFVFD